MAKMIRHNYSAILIALNNMIVAEVKAALKRLPGKCITAEGGNASSLCRIVVSSNCDYDPRDLSVDKVWLNDEGTLCFSGTENHGSYIVDDDPDPWTENDDLLDITDFGYLIDQIAEKVGNDKTYNLPNATILVCGSDAELSLKSAMQYLTESK